MKRTIFIAGLLVLFSSCNLSRVFYFRKDKPALKTQDGIDVSSATHDIYIREICTTDEKGKETYAQCPVNNDDCKIRKLELEYLFVPTKGGKLIYITNFSDKYERIYRHPGYQFGNNVRVNIFYLSKFYIGKIDEGKNEITFIKDRKWTRKISYESLSTEIKFNSIAEYKKNKHKATRQMTALAPPTTFRKIQHFQWIYSWYDAESTAQDPDPPVSVEPIIYIKTDDNRGIYFHLDKPVDTGDGTSSWIRFLWGRLATKRY